MNWKTMKTYGCHFPVESLPDISEQKDLSSIDPNIWYLGQVMMKKYFTVLDNRPQEALSEVPIKDHPDIYEDLSNKAKNLLGIAACTKHTARIAKSKEPAKADNEEEQEEPNFNPDAGKIIAILIAAVCIIGAIVYCYRRVRRND